MHHVVFLVLQDVTMPNVLGSLNAVTVLEPRTGGGGLPCGKSNFISTVTTSPGFILTVSFHPCSFGSGGRSVPGIGWSGKIGSPDESKAHTSRFLIVTLTRWKCMGCVSPVRL